NILKVFGNGQQMVNGSPNELHLKIKTLGDLLKDNHAKSSDLTFEQRLAIKLAHKITTDPDYLVMVGNTSNTAEPLVEAIKKLIDVEIEKAILKETSAGYVGTAVTRELKKAFVKFDKELQTKHNSAAVTYQEIEDKVNNKLKNKQIVNQDFSIHVIREAFVTDCESLKSVIETSVIPVIQMPDKKLNDYTTRFSKITGLNSLKYDDLDQIREKYRAESAK
ncbi:hypothetical protein, partial [Candidatus Cardinium sp. cBcalN1]